MNAMAYLREGITLVFGSQRLEIYMYPVSLFVRVKIFSWGVSCVIPCIWLTHARLRNGVLRCVFAALRDKLHRRA